MKLFVVFLALIVVGVFGALGIMGYQRLVPEASDRFDIQNLDAGGRSEAIVKKGVLQKVANATDDYTHLLKTSVGLVKVNSYSVNLDDYVGKTVELTGQYSGTTLFVDSVK